MDQNTALYNNIYKPIRTKVEEWRWDNDYKPKSNYKENREEHDEFRSQYDRDCVLTGGELKAAPLFSLWTPLQQTILRINDRERTKSSAFSTKLCSWLMTFPLLTSF